MRWKRLISVFITAFAGCGGAWSILTADDAPKAFLAISGILLIAGFAAFVVLIAFLYSVVVDDLRPKIFWRAPAVPIAISHSEASLIGQRRFRLHPVQTWAGLTLNHRFFFGFMTFADPEYLRLYEEPDQPEHRQQGRG